MEIRLGDIVHLRKKHPCGSFQWEITRLGIDIGLRCLKCQRHILLERRTFERRVKSSATKDKHEAKELTNPESI